ncbi:MAG TPA: protein TolQ, partial [Rhodobiaceae bacterium]|nr:protein TolQ [Rhodobiaceae bacterium]
MDPVTTTQVITETTAADAVPLDFSIWGLFMRADIIVKLVMLGLFFAS